MEELNGHPRLLPQWVLLPHHTGEFPNPRRLLDEMISKGVLTARMFPSEKASPRRKPATVSRWPIARRGRFWPSCKTAKCPRRARHLRSPRRHQP